MMSPVPGNCTSTVGTISNFRWAFPSPPSSGVDPNRARDQTAAGSSDDGPTDSDRARSDPQQRWAADGGDQSEARRRDTADRHRLLLAADDALDVVLPPGRLQPLRHTNAGVEAAVPVLPREGDDGDEEPELSPLPGATAIQAGPPQHFRRTRLAESHCDKSRTRGQGQVCAQANVPRGGPTSLCSSFCSASLTPIERMGAFPPRPGALERLLRAKGAARAHSRRPPPEISCHRPARARRPAASASVALAGVISKRLGTLDSPLGLFRARDQSRVLSFFRRLFTASEEQPSRRRCSPPRPRLGRLVDGINL